MSELDGNNPNRKGQEGGDVTTNPPIEDGGSGGKTDRNDSGRTDLQDARMHDLAIKRGWMKGQRWATDATATDIMAVQRERDLTMRERAALAVMTDISGRDPRIRQIAVKSAIAMEAQNQADETPTGKGHSVNLNVGLGVQLYLPDNGRAAPAVGALPDGSSK